MKKLETLFLAAAAATLFSHAHADEIAVGVQLPLSGTLARVGNNINDGIVAAAEVFNKNNTKHKIKLLTIDDESAPAKAISAVEKLASQGAVAITGGYGSNIVAPASDAANKLGLAYITCGAADDALVERGYKTYFRVTNSPGYQKAMTGLVSELGIKSVSIVHSTKESTQDLAKLVEADLVKRGIKTTVHPFDPAMTDFKPIVNKIKLQDKSEAMLMMAYENDYVGIIRAARVLKPNLKLIMGAWSLATPKMAADFPDLMPNVLGTALLASPVEYKSADGRAFAETYKKLFKQEPDYLAQFGYVQASLLFDAVARAADKGTLKKGGVVEELAKTDRDTLIGRVQFSAKGDNIHFLHHVGQHQPGKVAIVWPKADATGKINFPGVPW